MIKRIWKNITFLPIFSLYLIIASFLSSNVYSAEVDIGFAYLFGKVGIAMVYPTLAVLINLLIRNLFVITGLILLVVLIFAGIGVILNAGSGNPEAAKKNKMAATSAAIGLLLVFVAYWLIQIIEFVTGIKIFNPQLPY